MFFSFFFSFLCVHKLNNLAGDRGAKRLKKMANIHY